MLQRLLVHCLFRAMPSLLLLLWLPKLILHLSSPLAALQKILLTDCYSSRRCCHCHRSCYGNSWPATIATTVFSSMDLLSKFFLLLLLPPLVVLCSFPCLIASLPCAVNNTATVVAVAPAVASPLIDCWVLFLKPLCNKHCYCCLLWWQKHCLS